MKFGIIFIKSLKIRIYTMKWGLEMNKEMREYFEKRIAYTNDFEIAEEFSVDPYSDAPMQNTVPHFGRGENENSEKRSKQEKTEEN